MPKGSRGGKRGALKATHARQIQDMNEAQLSKEIERLENRTISSRKNLDKASNTSSTKFFDDIGKRFPGGVGGAAVDRKYQNMQKRYGNDLKKKQEAETKHATNVERLNQLKAAYKKVKGTGKTPRQYEKDKKFNEGKKGAKLGSKWTSSVERVGGLAHKVYKNGDYTIEKPGTGAYHVKVNGKDVGKFKSLSQAKASIK